MKGFYTGKQKISGLYGVICALLILSLTLAGCSKSEEKSEIELRREQREAEWQQRFAKKEITTEATVPYGPEVGLEEEDKKTVERPREMRIGVIGPETGELSEFGIKTLEGVLLAAEKINSSGGINGQKVEVIHYDSKSTTKDASAALAKLAKENVIAIIGSPTGEITFGATQMANMRHTIFISAGSRRRLGDSGPYIFRNTLPDTVAVNRLMEYVTKEEGLCDFAVVTSMSNDYSHQLSALFKSEIIDHGCKIVADIHLWSKDTANVSETETSIKDQIKEIKANGPEAIIYTGEAEEGARLMAEARRQGLRVPMIGCEDLFSREFIESGKEAVVGSILYTGFSPDWEEGHLKRFIEDYKSKKGKAPDELVALGYDAFNIVAKAIADAGSTVPQRVRDAMVNIKEFRGTTGILAFTEEREPVKTPFIYKVTKGGKGIDFSLVGIR